MLTEIQEKWLLALESGTYKQGRFSLHKNGAYCCLGIACEVLGIPKDESGNFIGEGTGGLSKKTQDAYGLRSIFGCIRDSGQLSSMNDADIPFKDIAKYIRDNEKDVFIC